MTAIGNGVRCIECSKRKTCKLRIDKYKLKPCKFYSPDIERESRLNSKRVKLRNSMAKNIKKVTEQY